MLYNVHDLIVGRSLELYGEYCEGEVDLFRQIVKPGWTVIEVGANIGAHTVFLGRQVGLQGAVIALEPQRLMFQLLCANVALNSLHNVHCFQHAAGDQRGSVVVPPIDYTVAGNFGGITMDSHPGGERVPLCMLDDLSLPAVHFLKIDVEGMEQQVLAGAAKLIARCKPVIYLENDRADKSDALVRYLDSLAYKMYWHESWYFSPRNFYGNQDNQFPNTVTMNMLCIHASIPHEMTEFQSVSVPPAEPPSS